MKKQVIWMMAAILTLCGTTMFTSCSNDDNPVTPDLNIAEKIIGKWMETDKNGLPVATNAKRVYTFVSTTKAYLSASLTMRPEYGACWSDQVEANVTINGNKVTLNVYHNEHKSSVHEITVTAINDSEFTAIRKLTITVDGNVALSEENTVRFVKTTADYSEAVLGLWECEGLIGDETYNDGNDRLEFLADGTYRFYHKDEAGQWQAVTTREFQDYFVDGTLLATRWKNKGEDELREWWEIASLSGNQMTWTALRQNADGTTFQQKMTWKRIDFNVSKEIVGKWLVAERDGKVMPTDKKKVFTFVSSTKAYVSMSIDRSGKKPEREKPEGEKPEREKPEREKPEQAKPEQAKSGIWSDHEERDVTISGNKVTLITHVNENETRMDEYIVTDMNDNDFTATSFVAGSGSEPSKEHSVRFVRIIDDCSTAIIGTWEGRCTSEGSVFDDGQEHRWQYNADGTFVYYVKDGDNWVPSDNTLNEYFVDGNLLCTRWVDNGVENREWWEVTIDGDKMNWTALRQNADGTTFTATFEMKSVMPKVGKADPKPFAVPSKENY